jgi:hypothetical protein
MDTFTIHLVFSEPQLKATVSTIVVLCERWHAPSKEVEVVVVVVSARKPRKNDACDWSDKQKLER